MYLGNPNSSHKTKANLLTKAYTIVVSDWYSQETAFHIMQTKTFVVLIKPYATIQCYACFNSSRSCNYWGINSLPDYSFMFDLEFNSTVVILPGDTVI